MAAYAGMTKKVTYGLTVCKLGSAPGPTFDNVKNVENIHHITAILTSLCATGVVSWSGLCHALCPRSGLALGDSENIMGYVV